MMTTTQKKIQTAEDVKNLGISLAGEFGKTAREHDENHSFVHTNYLRLKEENIFSAIIPIELGGGGWSYDSMCIFLQELAKGCSSTALALSMHQHLVAANVWKYKNGQGAEDLLRRIATNQLVLVSTGAGDWLSSSGQIKKTETGLKVSARKNFASQSPAGDLLVTSAAYHDPENGMQVLHFAVPFTSNGITIEDNWYAMGMRGTGSCTITLHDVSLPETSISLRRPMGEFHPFWNVVLLVAMPFIMSVYVGIAEKAANMALEDSAKKEEPQTPYLLGEMYNCLTTAKVMWEDMIRLSDNFNFQNTTENGNAILMRKTTVASSCIQTVQKAMEIIGGRGYLEKYGLEKLYRDVMAIHFHPLPEKEQQLFTGNFKLGKKITG